MSDLYHIVRLANGAYSLRSESYGETFHPVIGPVAEAQSLYVEQLRLADRLKSNTGEFVVWDVGLGGAANPITFLNAVRGLERTVRIISFDYTSEPLQLACKHADVLKYVTGWEDILNILARERRVEFKLSDTLNVAWELHLADFPTLLQSPQMRALAKPHAIFYDAFSPATNPAMWTLNTFTDLFRLLDPARVCSMPTYSRSTMLRVTLLLAGFYVGKGHATGEKEETTLASNSITELREPLDSAWLKKCRRSRSAEPLHQATYRQSPITEESWQQLLAHPQFRSPPLISQ